MPRYSYHCDSCDTTSDIFHAIGIIPEECPLCLKKDHFYKMVSKPHYSSKHTEVADPKEKVEKHISEARRELDQQIKDLRKEDMVDE